MHDPVAPPPRTTPARDRRTTRYVEVRRGRDQYARPTYRLARVVESRDGTPRRTAHFTVSEAEARELAEILGGRAGG